MNVGEMKDQKLELRNLHASHALLPKLDREVAVNQTDPKVLVQIELLNDETKCHHI